MSSDVHGLPAKWRQEADDDLDSVTSWKLARRRCADELEAALRQSGEAVATIHRDGYWTHEPGRDPFDRFGPNANSSGLKVYAAPPATSGLVEALHGCAKALPVLETMLTVSALHGGAEVTRKLLADVTAALGTRSTK